MITVNLKNDNLYDKLTSEDNTNTEKRDTNTKKRSKQKTKPKSHKRGDINISTEKSNIERLIKKIESNEYELIKKEPNIIFITKLNLYGLTYDKNLIQNDYCSVFVNKYELERFLNNDVVKNYSQTKSYYFNEENEIKQENVEKSIKLQINRNALNFNYTI